ncbi:MAG: flagellar basal body L-ring protein FlgH [Firmicutes bacterium]|nr:flagellar basal body L-ring protein FlgH [Bacillota bacterium]MDD4264471.1 flagellar basal body L-ring protein FlgH [Bacillota bacterium]MDD4693600.1 flagellar basal body L-ring protein FlgH [Bacillota bacterium]
MLARFACKTKPFRLFMVLVLCLSLTSLSFAESLWKQNDYNFFKTTVDYQVGDLVTVVVIERTEASQNASSSGLKDGSVGVNPGGGLLNFIPLISASGELEHNASGSTSKDNTFETSITTKVVEVLPNNIYKIEGKRIIKIDGEEQEIILSGYIRKEDISVNNTIYSTYLADAQIELNGSGVINNKTNPGLISRLLEWLF